MKGWGKSVNLCRCSGGEKALALKREKKLCHMVGTYCDKRDPILKNCLVKKTNFCCFDSKLSRIFQEQARKQLTSSPAFVLSLIRLCSNSDTTTSVCSLTVAFCHLSLLVIDLSLLLCATALAFFLASLL